MRSALLTRFCIVKHVKASPLFAQRTKRPIRILNEANKQVKTKQVNLHCRRIQFTTQLFKRRRTIGPAQ